MIRNHQVIYSITPEKRELLFSSNKGGLFGCPETWTGGLIALEHGQNLRHIPNSVIPVEDGGAWLQANISETEIVIMLVCNGTHPAYTITCRSQAKRKSPCANGRPLLTIIQLYPELPF